MSEFYTVPDVDEFDASKSEIVRKKEAGSTAISIITAWKNGFEKFWQTPRTHGNRAITADQLQATFNRDKSGFANILADSAAFRDFIVAQFPEHVGSPDRNVMTLEEDEAKILPSRYLAAPYPIDQQLNITGPLRPEWESIDD